MALAKLLNYLKAVYEGLEEGAMAVGRSPYNTTWTARDDRAAAKELTVIFATDAACVDVTDVLGSVTTVPPFENFQLWPNHIRCRQSREHCVMVLHDPSAEATADDQLFYVACFGHALNSANGVRIALVENSSGEIYRQVAMAANLPFDAASPLPTPLLIVKDHTKIQDAELYDDTYVLDMAFGNVMSKVPSTARCDAFKEAMTEARLKLVVHRDEASQTLVRVFPFPAEAPLVILGQASTLREDLKKCALAMPKVETRWTFNLVRPSTSKLGEIRSTLSTVVGDCISQFVELCSTKAPLSMSQLQFGSIASVNAMVVKFCSAVNTVLNVDPPLQDEAGADFRETLCRALLSASVSSFVDSLQAVVQSTTAPAHFAACLMRGFYLQHLAPATTAAIVHATNKKDLEGIDETRTLSLFHMQEGLAEELGARFVAVHRFWEHLPRYVEAAVRAELFPQGVATMHSDVAARWEAIAAHCKDFSDLDPVSSSIDSLIAEWRSQKDVNIGQLVNTVVQRGAFGSKKPLLSHLLAVRDRASVASIQLLSDAFEDMVRAVVHAQQYTWIEQSVLDKLGRFRAQLRLGNESSADLLPATSEGEAAAQRNEHNESHPLGAQPQMSGTIAPNVPQEIKSLTAKAKLRQVNIVTRILKQVDALAGLLRVILAGNPVSQAEQHLVDALKRQVQADFDRCFTDCEQQLLFAGSTAHDAHEEDSVEDIEYMMCLIVLRERFDALFSIDERFRSQRDIFGLNLRTEAILTGVANMDFPPPQPTDIERQVHVVEGRLRRLFAVQFFSKAPEPDSKSVFDTVVRDKLRVSEADQHLLAANADPAASPIPKAIDHQLVMLLQAVRDRSLAEKALLIDREQFPRSRDSFIEWDAVVKASRLSYLYCESRPCFKTISALIASRNKDGKAVTTVNGTSLYDVCSGILDHCVKNVTSPNAELMRMRISLDTADFVMRKTNEIAWLIDFSSKRTQMVDALLSKCVFSRTPMTAENTRAFFENLRLVRSVQDERLRQALTEREAGALRAIREDCRACAIQLEALLPNLRESHTVYLQQFSKFEMKFDALRTASIAPLSRVLRVASREFNLDRSEPRPDQPLINLIQDLNRRVVTASIRQLREENFSYFVNMSVLIHFLRQQHRVDIKEVGEIAQQLDQEESRVEQIQGMCIANGLLSEYLRTVEQAEAADKSLVEALNTVIACYRAILYNDESSVIRSFVNDVSLTREQASMLKDLPNVVGMCERHEVDMKLLHDFLDGVRVALEEQTEAEIDRIVQSIANAPPLSDPETTLLAEATASIFVRNARQWERAWPQSPKFKVSPILRALLDAGKPNGNAGSLHRLALMAKAKVYFMHCEKVFIPVLAEDWEAVNKQYADCRKSAESAVKNDRDLQQYKDVVNYLKKYHFPAAVSQALVDRVENRKAETLQNLLAQSRLQDVAEAADSALKHSTFKQALLDDVDLRVDQYEREFRDETLRRMQETITGEVGSDGEQAVVLEGLASVVSCYEHLDVSSALAKTLIDEAGEVGERIARRCDAIRSRISNAVPEWVKHWRERSSSSRSSFANAEDLGPAMRELAVLAFALKVAEACGSFGISLGAALNSDLSSFHSQLDEQAHNLIEDGLNELGLTKGAKASSQLRKTIRTVAAQLAAFECTEALKHKLPSKHASKLCTLIRAVQDERRLHQLVEEFVVSDSESSLAELTTHCERVASVAADFGPFMTNGRSVVQAPFALVLGKLRSSAEKVSSLDEPISPHDFGAQWIRMLEKLTQLSLEWKSVANAGSACAEIKLLLLNNATQIMIRSVEDVKTLISGDVAAGTAELIALWGAISQSDELAANCRQKAFMPLLLSTSQSSGIVAKGILKSALLAKGGRGFLAAFQPMFDCLGGLRARISALEQEYTTCDTTTSSSESAPAPASRGVSWALVDECCAASESIADAAQMLVLRAVDIVSGGEAELARHVLALYALLPLLLLSDERVEPEVAPWTRPYYALPEQEADVISLFSRHAADETTYLHGMGATTGRIVVVLCELVRKARTDGEQKVCFVCSSAEQMKTVNETLRLLSLARFHVDQRNELVQLLAKLRSSVHVVDSPEACAEWMATQPPSISVSIVGDDDMSGACGFPCDRAYVRPLSRFPPEYAAGMFGKTRPPLLVAGSEAEWIQRLWTEGTQRPDQQVVYIAQDDEQLGVVKAGFSTENREVLALRKGEGTTCLAPHVMVTMEALLAGGTDLTFGGLASLHTIVCFPPNESQLETLFALTARGHKQVPSLQIVLGAEVGCDKAFEKWADFRR